MNIIVGQPICDLSQLDIDPHNEQVIRIDKQQVINQDGTIFLPNILKQAGLFKSNSEIRKINEQRVKSDKITDPLEKNLWREIDQPEFSHFKIGKRDFWLVVGH